MFEVLQSHQWDATYGVHVKKKKNKRKEAENQNNKSNTNTQGTLLAQKVVCFCCGEEGHKSNACTQKDKIPKSEWAVKKGLTLLTEKNGDINKKQEGSQKVEPTKKTLHWSVMQTGSSTAT